MLLYKIETLAKVLAKVEVCKDDQVFRNKYCLNRGAVDAKDRLIHNVYAKQFNHGEQKSDVVRTSKISRCSFRIIQFFEN